VTRPGVILYGPPASGKDTVTAALTQLDSAYALFEKLKVGHGRTGGYRPTSKAALNRLRRLGAIDYENERFGNVYAVDRPALDAAFADGTVPVVHMGQIAGVRALRAYPAEWLSVLHVKRTRRACQDVAPHRAAPPADDGG
jgi:guanylate kinase